MADGIRFTGKNNAAKAINVSPDLRTMQPIVKSYFTGKQLFYIADTFYCWSDGKLEKVSSPSDLNHSQGKINIIFGAPYALFFIHHTNINAKIELRYADSYFLNFSPVPGSRRFIYSIGNPKDKKIILHTHVTEEGNRLLNAFKNFRFVPLPLFVYLRFCVTAGNIVEKRRISMGDDDIINQDNSFQFYTDSECMFLNAGLRNIKYCRLSLLTLSQCQNMYSEKHPEYFNLYTIKYNLADEKFLEKFLINTSQYKDTDFPKIRLTEYPSETKPFKSKTKHSRKLTTLVAGICLLVLTILSAVFYRQIYLENRLMALKQQRSINSQNADGEILQQILVDYKHSKTELFKMLEVTDNQKNDTFWLESIEKHTNNQYVLILNFLKNRYSYNIIGEYIRLLNMEIVSMETLRYEKYTDTLLAVKLTLKHAKN